VYFRRKLNHAQAVVVGNTFKRDFIIISGNISVIFLLEVCTNNSTSHIWSNLHGSGMRCNFFFIKKGQLTGIPNSGHPSYLLKELKNYPIRVQHQTPDKVLKISKGPKFTKTKKIIEIVKMGATVLTQV
jgi:hypothetical protein